MIRPSSRRYDPLIAINELGELEGVVHMYRLIQETSSHYENHFLAAPERNCIQTG